MFALVVGLAGLLDLVVPPLSHHFRRPAAADPRDRRDERQIKLMAMAVQNQEMLDALLEGAPPAIRQAMLERLLPYLPFVPQEYDKPVADCPLCGLRRGALVDHDCVTPAPPAQVN